jgi:hypothetical protein
MTRARKALIGVIVPLGVAMALVSACSSTSTGPLPTDGAGLVSVVCTKCHPIQRVQAARKSRDGWTRTVTRMQTHGLKVTNAQKQTIIDYLAQRDGG